MSTNQALTVETVKYTTQLPPGLIKWVKLHALTTDTKDYSVIQTALEAYRARVERKTPQAVDLFDQAA